jgi:ATP-binding cassette, subfamily B, multidrug efflux pump
MKKNKFVRIIGYLKPHLALLVMGLLLAILVNTSEILSPYITKVVIDDYIIDNNNKYNIEFLGTLYLFTVLFGSLFNYIQAYVLNSMGQSVMHNIRLQLFSHIQKLPLSFFDKNSSGRVMTRVTNDIEALNEMYSGVIVALFKDVFMLIGIVTVMINMDLKLSLVSFTIIPIIVIVTYLYNNKAKRNFRRVRNLIAQINGFFAENISGMKLVQIFHREKEKYKEFEKLNGEYNSASILEVVLMALFKPAAELINSLAISIMIWYCAGKIFNSNMEIGVLYAFITYIKKFFGPINDLADKYNTIQSGSVSAERIFELLDNVEGKEDLEKGQNLSDIKGEIEFKNVWFAYNDKDWILKDVSFKVEPGETIAFVGATGSGKTTIINLIGRFYEIQKGEITIDGINIKDIKLSLLRQYVSVVMQDVFLFAGDIESNIRLNNDKISGDDIIQASKYANAHEFIEQLPGKYSEEVKERGCTLSAGQRQLLSFARAIAHKPAILVLDEATANIDTESEQLIQDSLNKITKDRTTLIIAHRLSTIRNADKIIVIHKGKIKEIGNHEELLQANGFYKKLYDVQTA